MLDRALPNGRKVSDGAASNSPLPHLIYMRSCQLRSNA